MVVDVTVDIDNPVVLVPPEPSVIELVPRAAATLLVDVVAFKPIVPVNPEILVSVIVAEAADP